jgi:putative hemolysin
MRGFAMLGAALLASACVPAEAPDTAEQPFQTTLSDADRATCAADGGTVERRGRLGAELCVVPFADAGKSCTDASQCEGQCIAEETGPQPEAENPKGMCQADDKLFGCYSTVENGKIANTICVD